MNDSSIGKFKQDHRLVNKPPYVTQGGREKGQRPLRDLNVSIPDSKFHLGLAIEPPRQAAAILSPHEFHYVKYRRVSLL